jgi:hypothetical protein
MWETFLQRPEVAEAPREKRIHIFEKILREHVEDILQQEQAVLESGGG